MNSCAFPWRNHPKALWVEMVWNQHIQFINIYLFSMSSGAGERASEWANEWAQWSARAKLAVRSKWMSERCKQINQWTSKWLSATSWFLVVLNQSAFIAHCIYPFGFSVYTFTLHHAKPFFAFYPFPLLLSVFLSLLLHLLLSSTPLRAMHCSL